MYFQETFNDLVSDLLSKLKLNNCIQSNTANRGTQLNTYQDKINFIDNNYPSLSQKQKKHLINFLN